MFLPLVVNFQAFAEITNGCLEKLDIWFGDKER